MNPLVTVVCLCYNHRRFIKEALDSLLAQSYAPMEIIIIDDGSTDGSRSIISNYVGKHPGIQVMFNEKNIGSCSAFNKAYKLAKGKYIIDFATDDVMKVNKIERQIEVFEKLDESYGVVFSNAQNIDENSFPLGEHFKTKELIPQGFIYPEVLKRFFIPTITMMVKKSVFDQLGGYDESLSYEDFDFWVRSSNKFKYHYINEVLMQRRIVKGSLSGKFLQKNESKMLESSLRVCEKALWLNKNNDEKEALIQRLNIEMRLAFITENFNLAKRYHQMLLNLEAGSAHSLIINLFSNLKIRVHWLYRLYLKIRS
jgi:glycosyltransferase involved in cell wall biosynthesis